MEVEEFKTWLEQYGKCWESGDSKKIVELFSEEARYYETPFDEPMIGRAAIEHYWSEGAEHTQENVCFSFNSATVHGFKGLCHWQASFVRVPSGVQVELDGYLEADFDTNAQCFRFREWWHKRETEELYTK